MNVVKLHHCSFCRSNRTKTEGMIEGPDVNICFECVDLCAKIVADNRADKVSDEQTKKGKK